MFPSIKDFDYVWPIHFIKYPLKRTYQRVRKKITCKSQYRLIYANSIKRKKKLKVQEPILKKINLRLRVVVVVVVVVVVDLGLTNRKATKSVTEMQECINV